jgi:hypothetical protein
MALLDIQGLPVEFGTERVPLYAAVTYAAYAKPNPTGS